MSKNPAPEKHFPIKKKRVIAMLFDFGRKAKMTPEVPEKVRISCYLKSNDSPYINWGGKNY